MTFLWTPDNIARIGSDVPTAPVITASDVPPLVAGRDFWDHWPVLEEDGAVAALGGGALVIALSAPIVGDPEARHALARLRLLHRFASGWRDLGDLLPDGLSPGSREWAGSATIDPAHRRITLHFTAAGHRDEPAVSFDQRLFSTSAAFDPTTLRLVDWSPPVETIRPDDRWYQSDLAGGAAIGTIKAFRDPYAWRNPADGADYLIFAGSRPAAPSPWNGVVGIARRDGDTWALQPPLVDATGLNNELERPHLVTFAGRLYLFWSTQHKVFAADNPAGPTGLYGVVADTIEGPWRPLNGSGLVFRNPPTAPFQAYSWQVLANGSVWSFADYVGLDRPPSDAAEARRHFGGNPAPPLRLAIDDDRVTLR